MATSGSASQTASTFTRWYVLLLLAAIYAMNLADRQIIGILAEDVKRDLALSDSEIGLLAGPAISFFYAILGVPMAYAADRVNRVRFLSACLVIWSVFTMLGGKATNLLQLAATRIGVSVAEAGATPSSASLIADYFPQGRRATAMAIYSSGTTLGIFIAYALGGYVNQHYGWRTALFAAGVPGVVLALIMVLTVREPVRGSGDEKPKVADPSSGLSMWATVAHILRIKLIRQAIFMSGFCTMGVYGILIWVPPFAVRTFDVGIGQVGAVMGTGIAVVGGGAMILAGIVTDWAARRSMATALLVIMSTVALSGVFVTVALFAPNFQLFSILMSIGYGLLVTYSPIIWLIVQGHSPAGMRATATSVMLLAMNLLGAVPAPLIVGILSDTLRPSLGGQSLQFALLLVPFAIAVSVLLFLQTALTARKLAQEDA